MKDNLWRVLNKIPTAGLITGMCSLSYLIYLKGGHNTIKDLKKKGIHFCDADGNMMIAKEI